MIPEPDTRRKEGRASVNIDAGRVNMNAERADIAAVVPINARRFRIWGGDGNRGEGDGPTNWPDVRGLPNAEAAEAYAKAGIPVVPVRPGTKNPGSYLGRGWPQIATTDLDTVRDWWRRWPDAGIAMHVGGAQLLVIDVDTPENVPERLRPLLEKAVFLPTTSDPESNRGHYVYRLRPGDRFGGGLGKLKPPKGENWGEVRCFGGAIVLAPTVHPRAAEGGAYTAIPDQPIPYRPEEIAAKLNAVADPGDRRPLNRAELDAQTKAFLDCYTDDDEPYALAPILAAFDPTPGGRHGSMWDALCWALREAKAGRFSAQRAVDELREGWDAAFEGGSRVPDPDEYDRMVLDAIAVADADDVETLRARIGGFTDVETYGMAQKALAPGGKWHPDTLAERLGRVDPPEPATTNPRYRLVSARELAQPVKPMRWLVRGLWPERSAGVLAGDKKSMKTWNLQAIALAVAAGTALFDKYHVTSPGGVLYLSGEGGRDMFANRHQVIAARFGIGPKMLRKLPFGAEFGVGALTDEEFRDAVKRHLDTLQPKLVILDPLYAYHPQDVEVQNVYARGPMLTDLRTLVGDEAALIIGDHFNKTASARLDLGNIAQAGMAQWADSWILQKHRETPNLDDNKFWLEVETGTRRGGGKHLEVDWTLERDHSDPDVILWTGVDWDARPAAKADVGQRDDTVQHILQVVDDHPFELTETGVLDKVGGNRQKAYDTLEGLRANGGVVVQERERKEGKRLVKRKLVGLGPMAEKLRLNRFRRQKLAPATEGVEATATDDGTGSERVDP